MWCWKTRALPITFATFCDCTFSGEVLQEVVIFAIATFVLTSSRIFSSHSCFVLRNAWHKPVKTIDHCDLWVLWSRLHINCAYPFFIFFPYIWLYHLASGDTVQVPCLSENSPSFTCHILSSHMHKSLRNNANMRDAHVAFVWFVCMFNVLLIYPR